MTTTDSAYARIVGPFCDGVRADYAAQLVELPCSTPGCTDTALVHPTEMAAFGFDEANVMCDDCLRASIPPDVLAMRPASAPPGFIGPLEEWEQRATWTDVAVMDEPPSFFPSRDVIDWEMGWMRLLHQYETAAETMGRLMDEALGDYDADADLHASWEIAPA